MANQDDHDALVQEIVAKLVDGLGGPGKINEIDKHACYSYALLALQQHDLLDKVKRGEGTVAEFASIVATLLKLGEMLRPRIPTAPAHTVIEHVIIQPDPSGKWWVDPVTRKVIGKVLLREMPVERPVARKRLEDEEITTDVDDEDEHVEPRRPLRRMKRRPDLAPRSRRHSQLEDEDESEQPRQRVRPKVSSPRRPDGKRARERPVANPQSKSCDIDFRKLEAERLRNVVDGVTVSRGTVRRIW